MELTQELFQKCRRISNAIQDFLLQTGMADARSTDVYDFLSRKGLVEKDRHAGLRFRSFLKELKESNLLYLIKQCSCVEKEHTLEWYFNPVHSNNNNIAHSSGKSIRQHRPVMDKQDIELLLNKEAPNVACLPVRNDKKYTPQELELKRYYPLAYEYWTDEELKIMSRVYALCKSVDTVASLLKRQPHVVKEKLTIKTSIG
ncbi:hypothetical protein [Filimonas effusa]|uniref:Uncharacterized protein n=1 Tax=Filimonas effusa TaxID=2508721 RepID=A0A4Q1DC36_9BACT|nr:hypothetical protein [Filimonas effusa]RXK87041.1 hypothetical protein ESB13_09725 [Filimonas effusa]